jgi:GNAT superfamily N-acetyltransferase
VWTWESHVEDADLALFIQHGLWPTETHVAMYADLSKIPGRALPPPGLEIKRATTASQLLQFGEVTAALFGASDEGRHVFAYFQSLAEHPSSRFPAMHHYLGTLHGTVVAIGTLFVGSQTTGIYDLVTCDDYRRRGIGSAMFQYLLHEARSCNCRFCVLQASPDGLGIYSRAGFEAVGEVQTFENRRHLFG